MPFADDTFAEVLAINILEHVDLVDAMREIHRVLEPGGRLVAEVPHFTSADMYGDPTHRIFFSLAIFEFYTDASSRDYYFDFGFSRIEHLYLSFPRRKFYLLSPFIEWLVNKHPISTKRRSFVPFPRHNCRSFLSNSATSNNAVQENFAVAQPAAIFKRDAEAAM